jgi:hypothetical protein
VWFARSAYALLPLVQLIGCGWARVGAVEVEWMLRCYCHSSVLPWDTGRGGVGGCGRCVRGVAGGAGERARHMCGPHPDSALPPRDCDRPAAAAAAAADDIAVVDIVYAVAAGGSDGIVLAVGAGSLEGRCGIGGSGRSSKCFYHPPPRAWPQ